MSWHDREPLKVNREMEETHLIQRLKQPHIFKINGKELDNPFSLVTIP